MASPSRFGYCAQTVCLHCASRLGISDEQAIGMASAFGTGMGHAETCGCISGAHLVLGLYYGSAATMEEAKSRKPLLLEKVAEFERRFSQTQPHRLCRDILGMDITQPGVMREAAEKGLFRSVCGEMTKRTCDILADMLDEEAARKAAGRESDGSGDAAGQGK
ncbi:C-GCAxxG-C-C family protein [uncultured Mailhella sp.]|uniref:C-GCAxxG-C-C family protein n=1 Tax=uncultured Mailhella sp. TaxID=1981031 RepID=UPI0025F901BB|nr:C-GCAxxG-C-C family protein [uncultured Mailhella sp.]